jgi:lipopolysaccharide biosynthesis glycosyltransferase
MKIAFAIDENFIEPLAVTLRSFLDFHSTETLEFFLLCKKLSNANKEKVSQIITVYSATIKIIELEEMNVEYLKVNLHFANSNYYRLLLPDHIQEDKLLYLDAGLLFRGSLREV